MLLHGHAGGLFHPGHMARAVCCRGSGVSLPIDSGLRVNHPALRHALGQHQQKNAQRDTYKSSSLAANWNLRDPTVEMLDGPSGEALRICCSIDYGIAGMSTKAPFVSRLCPASMLQDYTVLCERVGRRDYVQSSYASTKALLTPYIQAQREMHEHMLRRGSGQWIVKPPEIKMFNLENAPLV